MVDKTILCLKKCYIKWPSFNMREWLALVETSSMSCEVYFWKPESYHPQEILILFDHYVFIRFYGNELSVHDYKYNKTIK